MFKRLFHKHRSPGNNTISFFCLDTDSPLEINLEPWASFYIVNPGETIKFVPIEPTAEFIWSVQVDNDTKFLQLYADITGSFKSIQIFVNEELIDEVDI